jgi:hypothetical protein
VRIFAEFQTQHCNAQAAPIAEQLSHWIHGKLFWKKVVNPVMNNLLGQMEAGDRRKKILRKLPQPDDLQPILERLR